MRNVPYDDVTWDVDGMIFEGEGKPDELEVWEDVSDIIDVLGPSDVAIENGWVVALESAVTVDKPVETVTACVEATNGLDDATRDDDA